MFLAGLLEVLLVHVALLLAHHVGGQGLRAGGGRAEHGAARGGYTRTQRTAQSTKSEI